VTYSLRRREALAEMLRHHQVLVLEDDPYAEITFTGALGTSLRAWLGDQVILIGSFSKIVAPGLRLGWVVAPHAVLRHLVLSKQGSDFHSSYLAQCILWEYLAAGEAESHIAARRARYAAQAQALIEALRNELSPQVRFTEPLGGMFTWLTLPPQADTLRLLELAIAEGVSFLPGAAFYNPDAGAAAGRCFLRLSFSYWDPAHLREGARRLGRALHQHLTQLNVV